ncbi:hypothetical protein EI94DRAFT_1737843 [Lactarius quietus]|nr:hypothetical protein EI94DRAFT_1737843 [Lactarius quietus]
MTILSTPSFHALLHHLISPRLSFLSLGSTRIAYPPHYQPVCALRCGIPRLLQQILSTRCGVSDQRTGRHSRPLYLSLLPGDTVVDRRAWCRFPRHLSHAFGSVAMLQPDSNTRIPVSVIKRPLRQSGHAYICPHTLSSNMQLQPGTASTSRKSSSPLSTNRGYPQGNMARIETGSIGRRTRSWSFNLPAALSYRAAVPRAMWLLSLIHIRLTCIKGRKDC